MNEAEKPFTLESAWELFRDAVQWLHGIFGPPKHVLHCGTQTRKDYNLLAGWLRSLEALVSCLLLIAAAEVKLSELARKPRVRRIAKRKAGLWRVRFRVHGLAQKPRSAHAPRTRGKTEATRFPSTHGLAARFEALRRVAENPIAYAVRLARALKRDRDLPRRIASAKLYPHDPFAPNAEAAKIYLLSKFPSAACDTS